VVNGRRLPLAAIATMAFVACTVTFHNPPGWVPERNVFVLHFDAAPATVYPRVVAAVTAESLAIAASDPATGVLTAAPFHIVSYGNDYATTIHATVAPGARGTDVTLSGNVINQTSAGLFELPLVPSRSGAWARLQRIADHLRSPQ
jgi:hypothetical protein